MVFWRKKKNQKEQEREEQEDKVVHPPSAPAIEPSTDYESEITIDQKEEIEGETEIELTQELDETPVPEHTPDVDEDDADLDDDHSDEGGWFSRLSSGLSKSSKKLTTGISDVLIKKKLDQDTLDELEDLLITADLGPKTAARLVEEFAKDRFGKDVTDQEVKEALSTSISEILKPVAKELSLDKPESGGPLVILVCGVNGAGKTTTIGKLAHELHIKQKKKVMIAAGDTFRAAAIEQLQVWADRSFSTLIKKDIGSDSAAVAYEAYEKAKSEGADILFIDTAGRLQNKSNLMDELAKIIRVLQKQDESLPHEVLLVLDATTGQNAYEQVRIFGEMVNVTGLAVTKLDGSAKGGVVVGLADQFGLPINLVGVGEQIGDLQPFHAEEFAKSLVGLNS